jgi:hypothetical protein
MSAKKVGLTVYIPSNHTKKKRRARGSIRHRFALVGRIPHAVVVQLCPSIPVRARLEAWPFHTDLQCTYLPREDQEERRKRPSAHAGGRRGGASDRQHMQEAGGEEQATVSTCRRQEGRSKRPSTTGCLHTCGGREEQA